MITCYWIGYTCSDGAALQGIRIPLLTCAGAAPDQPDGQPVQEATKRCRLCGNERTLFYFPKRKSQPDGWVHCYACQREQRQKVNSSGGCALTLLPMASCAACLCALHAALAILHLAAWQCVPCSR